MKPSDVVFMQRALSLAVRGKGRVSPNPMVGCVIVKNGRVVGEGFHAAFGGPHAEINALKAAGARARGADMYVTLEPCAHWGKTGPCAPRVVEAGLRRVHVAMLDPFPLVAGRGVRALRRAGIKVAVGTEKEAAVHLNRAFLTNVRKKRPHVVYKAAMSLDGKTAARNGHSRWITGAPARNLVHALRAQTDAVVVGATTAAVDDPLLTSHGAGRNPLRVVIDRTLRVPPTARLYADASARTLVAAGKFAARARQTAIEKRGVQVIRLPERGGRLDLNALMSALRGMNVGQVLLEGGGDTAWTFAESGLIDEALFFVAPKFIGGRGAPSPLGGAGVTDVTKGPRFKILSTARVGDDLLVHGIVVGTGA